MSGLKWSPTASEFEIAFEYYITFSLETSQISVALSSFKTDMKQHFNNKGKSCCTVFFFLFIIFGKVVLWLWEVTFKGAI